MGLLFNRKKKKNNDSVGTDSSSFGEETITKKGRAIQGGKNGSKLYPKKQRKLLSMKLQQQQHSSPTRSKVRELNATLPISLTSGDNEEDEISSVDLGDIPRSISTTTQSPPDSSAGSGELLPPPSPRTPNRDDGRNDEDSIGSPVEAMRRLNNEQTRDVHHYNEENQAVVVSSLQTTKPPLLSTKKLAAKLSSQSTPSIHLLPEYISALTEVHSPDPSADLPSRALKALFALSEHASSHDVRVAMVRDGVVAVANEEVSNKNHNKSTANDKNNNTITNKKAAGPLIPTLLTFLQRCPRDSSEQYLSLLVLNNLSIPMENKCLVALECGAANVLGRMLMEDVGCHLLVIIIVNLTFCDVDVRKSLLLGDSNGSSGGSEVQLIDCLAYALMLSSVTNEQLSTLGPIPLCSPNGTPHTPRQLLSILRSTLSTTFPNYIHNNDDSNNISPPLLLLSNDENCPFPETARWCLCALKNLTRPGKLSSTSNYQQQPELLLSGDAIAARAIIDAGLVPILLRVIRVAKSDRASSGNIVFGSAAPCDPFVGRLPDEICNEGYVVSSPNMINMPTWNSNSAQDAALYTLMHMTSISSVRDDLLRKSDYVDGGSLVIDELKNIVDCGLDGVGVGDDRLLDMVTGDGLVADVDKENGVWASNGGGVVNEADLGWLALQCMKARMSLSFLLTTGASLSEKYSCSSYTLLAEHEAHSMVELLSHCLEIRSKEGPGGYSGATFSLKGVLHSIRCLLTEPGNRSKFASINGARLNALLLKVVAQYALLSDEGGNSSRNDAIDNEAVDHAVVSLYYMSQVGFHEFVCMSSHGQSTFLPSIFGRKSKAGSSNSVANCDAKDILVKVLTLYVGKIDASSAVGRHAAVQLMLRASLLRFEGEVTNLTYIGKRFPSRMDFDFNDEMLAAADSLLIEKQTEGVRPNPILFGRRQIARYERYGRNTPKLYANPIIAAEEIAFSSLGHSNATIDDIAIANDIASCAEGSLPSGESHGFIWKWEDGVRVAIDDVQSEVQEEREAKNDEFFARAENKITREKKDSPSTAPKHRGLLGRLGNLMSAYDDEPVSIFGFRCAPPRCGRNSVL